MNQSVLACLTLQLQLYLQPSQKIRCQQFSLDLTDPSVSVLTSDNQHTIYGSSCYHHNFGFLFKLNQPIFPAKNELLGTVGAQSRVPHFWWQTIPGLSRTRGNPDRLFKAGCPSRCRKWWENNKYVISHPHLMLQWWWPHWNFAMMFDVRKLECCGYKMNTFDSMFSHSVSLPDR